MTIFEDKTAMPKEKESRSDDLMPAMSYSAYPKGDAPVRTALSCEDVNRLRMSNYPRYDAMDVQNLKPRMRGHHY